MKRPGKPDTGNPFVRFDEGRSGDAELTTTVCLICHSPLRLLYHPPAASITARECSFVKRHEIFFGERAGQEPSIRGPRIKGAKESKALDEFTDKRIHWKESDGRLVHEAIL